MRHSPARANRPPSNRLREQPSDRQDDRASDRAIEVRGGSASDVEVAGGSDPIVIKMPVDIRSVALSVLALVAAIFLLRYLREVAVPVVLSALIFYALDPVVDWLERWRAPRALGAAMVLLMLLGVGGWGVYSLSGQAMQVVEDLPQAARKLRSSLRVNRTRNDSTLDKVQKAAKELEKTAVEATGPAEAPPGVQKVQVVESPLNAGEYVRWGSMGAATLAIEGLMIMFLSYFLLVSDDLYKRKLVKLAGPTLTRKKVTLQVLDDISDQIERFLVVQVLTSLLVGGITWTALWWIGLEQAAVWGIAAGVLNSIPYFGPIIVTGGLTLVAYLQFGTVSMAAVVAGLALLITSLEGWFLMPTLMGKAARMNQAAVFVGLLFWGWMWGAWGILLAVPMMVIIKTVCDRIEDLRPIGELLGE